MADEYIVPEQKRVRFIESNILAHIGGDIDGKRTEITDLVNRYEGQDFNALSVMAYAAERGQLDDYMAKLQGHYDDSLFRVHPGARKVNGVPGAMKTEAFFVGCYKELGIQPRN